MKVTKRTVTCFVKVFSFEITTDILLYAKAPLLSHLLMAVTPLAV